MRMTRAALRAQAHDDSDLHPTNIHEDIDANASQNNDDDSEESGGDLDLHPARRALKDITYENNANSEDLEDPEKHTSADPTAQDGNSDVNDGVVDEQTVPAPAKKTRNKRKGKQSRKVKDKLDEDSSINHEGDEEIEETSPTAMEETQPGDTNVSAEATTHGKEDLAEIGTSQVVTEEINSTKSSVSSETLDIPESFEQPPQATPGVTESHHTTSSEVVDGPVTMDTEVNNHLACCEEAVDATKAEESEGLQTSISTPENIRCDPPKTPKFDPSVHALNEDVATPAADTAEDSFVDKIKSRSPTKMQSHSELNHSESFVEGMMTRTPRIEDSVEAIDALEDAIEKVSEDLPVLDGLQIESPVKSKKNMPARVSAQPTAPVPSTLEKTRRSPAKKPLQPTKTAPANKPAGQPKSTLARAPAPAPKPATKTSVVTKQPKKPIIDGHKPRESTASTLPSLSFSNSPSKALPNTSQKRVPSARLSTARPAFVPTKSAKPPTKSTFSLPGEAISAKLKAQREERLKREEEAEKERKQFKARPVPTKTSRPSVLPRENKASQARMSLYATGVNKENIAPKRASAPVPTDTKVRPLSIGAKPSSDQTRANSSVRRATNVMEKPRLSTTTKPRVSSLQLTAGQKSTVTKDDVVHQKAKGREVFSRNKAEMERLEKERREKEEATRRARAEAAERGRQASREWAEKQKKKMALQAGVTSGTANGSGKVDAPSRPESAAVVA
ncbi:hypothetical protein A1O1_08826 [Capronia coronata CBS 617.96]|uniref:Carboxylesterase family protein n=1 Tax=Capronia coronata CBS 617.96 TaxID=1182541 RepID=W9XNA6_9EURO|nr:uncharacterized protein A1O1_08826 [Capronia coronata CBS 617.96]EXJ78426.1 hypothetical protein A1O1_08826 [Capronia coronata CBS 617.96]